MSSKTNSRQRSTDITDHVSYIADDIHDVRDAAKRAAMHGADAIRETAGEYLDRGRTRAREMGETVHGHLREQPVKSLAIAGAIGFILGMLWVRK